MFDNDILPSWRVDYNHHLRDLILSRLRVVFLLVVLIVGLDGSVQFILNPTLFHNLVWVRAGVIILDLVLWGLTYMKAAMRGAFALSLVGLLIVTLDVEMAIIASGNYHSFFQTGLVLIIVAVGLLFPYSFRQMGIACVLIWIVYLTPVFIGKQLIVQDESGFFENAFFLICSSAIALTASFMSSRLRQQEFFSRQALKEEQEKSERLLLNVLPAPIAQRLKNGEEPISDSFDDVTVLFADIVDFTPFSENLLPADLITLLNGLFSCFDELAKKYGLEKIKTIGDAYMVAGGMLIPNKNNAEAVAAMALDMMEAVARFSNQLGTPLDIRIGINTGPVIAGVIGKEKFIYDLWGDTVNTASRMESHGMAGRIQTTESIYARLHEKYEFEARGVIHIKGKGDMRTYFLKGPPGIRL